MYNRCNCKSQNCPKNTVKKCVNQEEMNNCRPVEKKCENNYYKCDHYYEDPSTQHVNNNYVRNNHRTKLNHYYVNDNYYVNDYYYQKNIYHYDNNVVYNSKDMGTETIIDPDSDNNCKKPIPCELNCNDNDYIECSEEEFKKYICINDYKKESCKNNCYR